MNPTIGDKNNSSIDLYSSSTAAPRKRRHSDPVKSAASGALKITVHEAEKRKGVKAKKRQKSESGATPVLITPNSSSTAATKKRRHSYSGESAAPGAFKNTAHGVEERKGIRAEKRQKEEDKDVPVLFEDFPLEILQYLKSFLSIKDQAQFSKRNS